MNTKKCNKCGEIKPLVEFHKNKASKDGHQPQCKGCAKRNYQENKESVSEKAKLYYKENREVILERGKRYTQANKESVSERRKLYREENRVALAEKAMHYKRERRATDPLFRLTDNIRSLIAVSLTNGGYSKKSKTHEILGCTYEEFHQHIEAQFTDGMSWQRMDEIHIDHRLPLSAANTEAELLVLNHHRNLQPMWAADNLAKSDSYCSKELAAYFKKHLPN